MKNFLKNIDFYIDQYDVEKSIFDLGKVISKRGWLNRDEFLTICLWKSRRPKKLYEQNSYYEIKSLTKICFKEKDERKKILFLTNLKGVSIPTASAILSVLNPIDYPIIDVRCVQSLKQLKYINWTTITIHTWNVYLSTIRKLSLEYNKTAREIEKGLFAYNRIQLDKEFKNLYN
jgi:thermostable 8-oxoguanine DNA glycosylase